VGVAELEYATDRAAAWGRFADDNQGFFFSAKKTRNTKIAFLGLGRFFLLPAKNFGLFELPHSSPTQITSHPKP
jgi:hypothetical protein